MNTTNVGTRIQVMTHSSVFHNISDLPNCYKVIFMRETSHQQFSYIFLESIPFRVYYTFAQGNLLKHNLQGKTYLGRKMAAILNFARYFKQLEFDLFLFYPYSP